MHGMSTQRRFFARSSSERRKNVHSLVQRAEKAPIFRFFMYAAAAYIYQAMPFDFPSCAAFSSLKRRLYMAARNIDMCLTVLHRMCFTVLHKRLLYAKSCVQATFGVQTVGNKAKLGHLQGCLYTNNGLQGLLLVQTTFVHSVPVKMSVRP